MRSSPSRSGSICSCAPTEVELRSTELDEEGDAVSGTGIFGRLSKWWIGACAWEPSGELHRPSQDLVPSFWWEKGMCSIRACVAKRVLGPFSASAVLRKLFMGLML